MNTTKQTSSAEPIPKFKRSCMYCGKEMDEPLHVGNLIYKFCCLEHKHYWDSDHRAVARAFESEDL